MDSGGSRCIRVIGFPPGDYRKALSHFGRFGNVVQHQEHSSFLLVWYATSNEARQACCAPAVLLEGGFLCGAHLVEEKMLEESPKQASRDRVAAVASHRGLARRIARTRGVLAPFKSSEPMESPELYTGFGLGFIDDVFFYYFGK